MSWWRALVVVAVVGCGGEETSTHDELGEQCTELAEACHDATGDEAAACHYVAYEGVEADCGAEMDTCMDVCGM